MTGDVGRPIRVVFFGGAYLERGARRFLALLEAHPEVELVAGLCESEGFGWRQRWRNLWKRRGPFAVAVLAVDLAGEVAVLLRAPREWRWVRRHAALALARVELVPDIHTHELVERLRVLAPDLGVIYGSPILKPDLFGVPSLGTLGIHHGTVPHYRGKKTTFWEIYNGEQVAGITIQRVNPGIDTGEVVTTGEVAIGRKGYGRVWREVESLGADLYLAAVLDFKRGTAQPRPQIQPAVRQRLYRQPAPADIGRLWWSRLMGQRPPGATR